MTHGYPFNSSESFEVAEGYGLRTGMFHIETGQKAHLILTHPKQHKPEFTIHRVVGKVCGAGCPDKAGKEIVTKGGELTPNQNNLVIDLPGSYYLHSKEAFWMNDPCNPIIVEVHIA